MDISIINWPIIVSFLFGALTGVFFGVRWAVDKLTKVTTSASMAIASVMIEEGFVESYRCGLRNIVATQEQLQALAALDAVLRRAREEAIKHDTGMTMEQLRKATSNE